MSDKLNDVKSDGATPPDDEQPYLVATKREIVRRLPGRYHDASSSEAIPAAAGKSETVAVDLNEPDNESNAIELYDLLETCAVAISLLLLIFVMLLRTSTVSGPSMQPTLNDGDKLILQQWGYDDPQYEDIVVVDRTPTAEPPIIKRVIGRAGDVINIDFLTGQVWRNGELLDEPYIYDYTYMSLDVVFPVTVPEGTVFVMGDNRNHSLDSRSTQVGMVDLRRIMGKAVFRIFPLQELGPL